jgi:hypothetical protein
MGLLDDAIREHLELKRQHGAPDDEIVRAEQEALAPARRDATGAGVPPVQEVAGEDVEDVAPPPPPPPPVDNPVYADEPESPPRPVFEEPDPDAAPEPVFEQTAQEPELEEAPPPGTPKPHGDPAQNAPDRARTSILDDPLAEGNPDEDVLEETPEFLQDTPEHDKLWFEQKPPRDFDFE